MKITSINDISKIKFDKDAYQEFLLFLHSLQDEKYRKFNTKIINDNTVEYIGIRFPLIKEIYKELAKGDVDGFIKHNTHKAIEERLLHGMLIDTLAKNFDELKKQIKSFMPYFSNWALTDSVIKEYKQIKGHEEDAIDFIKKCTASDNPWEVRVGLMLLLKNFVTEAYINITLDICKSVTHLHYYVKMGLAWLLCECFIKFESKTLPLLESKVLNAWVQNKAISKIRDSFRVSKDTKEYIATIRIK